MIMAATRALALLSPAREDRTLPLLPPVADFRKVGPAVGEAVGKQAIADGVAEIADEETLGKALRAYVWEPVYLPYERLP